MCDSTGTASLSVAAKDLSLHEPFPKITRAAFAPARDDTELLSTNEASHHEFLGTTGAVLQSTLD